MSDLAEEIREKKISKYQKRIFFLLRSCYRFFQASSMDIQLIDQYMQIYRPLTTHTDPARLPFKSKGKLAIREKKRDCFFAMLNHVITQFWQYHEDQENEAVLEVTLMDAILEIEDVVKEGLEKYKVIGSDAEGYHFE